MLTQGARSRQPVQQDLAPRIRHRCRQTSRQNAYEGLKWKSQRSGRSGNEEGRHTSITHRDPKSFNGPSKKNQNSTRLGAHSPADASLARGAPNHTKPNELNLPINKTTNKPNQTAKQTTKQNQTKPTNQPTI